MSPSGSPSASPPVSDSDSEDDLFRSVPPDQKPDPKMVDILKSAQAGNVEDFSSLVSNLVDDKQMSGGGMSTRFPPGVKNDAFDLFVSQIRKPFISEDLSQLNLKLAAESLMGLEALWEHRAAFWLPAGTRPVRGMKFGILWSDMFRWTRTLVNALFNDLIDEDTSVVAIASTFILFRDIDLIHILPIFADPIVFRLAFRLWLSDVGADDGHMSLRSHPLAIACVKQLDFKEDNTPFLDAGLAALDELDRLGGKRGELARIAIERLDAILEKASGDNKLLAVTSTINTLWIIAKEDDPYGNKKALSTHPKGLPAVVRALKVIVDTGGVMWTRHMDIIHRGLDLIQTQVLVGEVSADMGRLAVVLRSGLLTTMQAISRGCMAVTDGSAQAMVRILNAVIQAVLLPNERVIAAAVDDARKLLDIVLPVEDLTMALRFIKSRVLKEPLMPSADLD